MPRRVRVPLELSEESLFGFLRSSGLPVVSSLSTLIRWVSLGLASACLLFGVASLVVFDDGFWSADLPWSGALPSLAAAPVFFQAWRSWRDRKLQRAATLLFVALFVLSILANWPRGAFSVAWYLHAVLSLLATVCLGVIPGLTLTLVAVTAMLVAAVVHPGDTEAAVMLPDLWVHVTSLAAVALASALAGAIVNRLLFLALTTVEAQRRKSLEAARALRYREKLLRHALRVETIGDVAGLVCHQLRNTFQVLLGHVTLSENADEAERVRRLGLIEETVQQTKPLLDELMGMAHPDEGSPVPTRIDDVLRHFHAQAKVVLPSVIQVELEIAAPNAQVLIDRRGLVHALWNLVVNARQAIPGTGTILLRCGGTPGTTWIEVTDTGSGIPKDVQPRIFEPYFTTKAPGVGTGLGLTAVARFVRGSRGEISVVSEPGSGTTFRMEFPVMAASTVQSA